MELYQVTIQLLRNYCCVFDQIAKIVYRVRVTDCDRQTRCSGGRRHGSAFQATVGSADARYSLGGPGFDEPGRSESRRKGQIYSAREVLETTNRYNKNGGVSKRVHEPAFGIFTLFGSEGLLMRRLGIWPRSRWPETESRARTRVGFELEDRATKN